MSAVNVRVNKSVQHGSVAVFDLREVLLLSDISTKIIIDGLSPTTGITCKSVSALSSLSNSVIVESPRYAYIPPHQENKVVLSLTEHADFKGQMLLMCAFYVMTVHVSLTISVTVT